MNEYQEAKELFYGDSLDKTHFNSLTFEHTKTELINSIKQKRVAMIFLLGDPGSGKSYLLNYIKNQESSIKVAKYFTYPFLDKREFLEALLSLAGPNIKRGTYSIEKILFNLQREFTPLEYVIFIDEAQHLTEDMVELIRVLSDHKVFQFVLAMHKKEGEYILSKSQYKTRPLQKIYLESLNHDEVLRYIQDVLLNNNLSSLATEFQTSYIKLINKFTNRNFRAIKKLLGVLFEVIEQANSKKLSRYTSINRHTITMAAIDIGLIDVKL
jgi:nucleoside-triphosphatase THEP1